MHNCFCTLIGVVCVAVYGGKPELVSVELLWCIVRSLSCFEAATVFARCCTG